MGAFIIGLLVGFAVFALVRSGQLTALKKQLGDAIGRATHFERVSADLGGRLQAADREIAFLSRYRNIPNAEAHAQQLVASAQQHASGLVGRATQESNALVERGRAFVAQAEVGAAKLAADANAAAAARIRESEAAANRIREDAAHFSAVAEAMKNVVQGYGERFVLPPSSVLDDLAEGYGHSEAGVALKAARAESKKLVKAGFAAACDYVEADRRATACAFVLDAFDGKAEAIFAKVKAENHGTLAQELRDAAALTNNLGRAFRQARVTPQYLDAKLTELRWASAVMYLKATEREEQRLLKEQMREEEKAQREFERAKQEAEKEESAIRKALEKAESSFAKASDAQRIELEAKIQALQGQLQTAEEKNKRAISMAQQTKKGNVYVISNVGSFGEHVYKIGLTRRLDPLDRIKELGDASVPFEFDVHALIPADDAPALEHALHKVFVRNQVNKVNPKKEFFRVTLEEIRGQVAKMGLAPAWTIAAEARAWRESQALEAAMVEGRVDGKMWEDAQVAADMAAAAQ